MIRRITIGVLTLLLALLVIGSIFYMPPEALNTLRPVPAHAQIVYRSDVPDRHVLEKLHFSNPWKQGGGFFRTLEKYPVAVAVATLGGRDRRDSWVAVSAPGPRAVLLRWQMKFFPPQGVRSLRSYGAWPVWQYSDPSFPPWVRVRFSIAEGMLICSVSDDSHDLEYLLDTFDGRRPSAERKGDR